MNLPIITELKMTCEASPTQWEGRLGDRRVVYIRYRHGELSWGIGATLNDAAKDSFNNSREIESYFGGGFITYRAMANALEGVFSFYTIDRKMENALYSSIVASADEIIADEYLHLGLGDDFELGFSTHSED